MLTCIISDMHPHELVRQALAAAATGRTARDISRDLGVPERTVAHWIRGDRRDPAPRPTGCPRCNGLPLAVAYSYLLGTYLGDGHITVGQRTACLWIYCADDRPGVRAEVEDAVAAVLPTSRVSVTPRTGCSAVKSFSRHWLCLFPQHGPGMKHTRRIALEPWQQEIVEVHTGPFLRGLFHSDGCRITNWTRRVVAGEIKRYE